MPRKRDVRDPLRNPYVRPVLLAGCVLLALWGASLTDFGQRALFWRMGLGHPLFRSDAFELSLPGVTYSEDSGFFGQLWFVEVRASAVAFLVACVTVAWLLRHTRRICRARRRPYGCVTCGYDLRASRDRCPECGEPIPGPGGGGGGAIVPS